jgi:hypothetical protein
MHGVEKRQARDIRRRRSCPACRRLPAQPATAEDCGGAGRRISGPPKANAALGLAKATRCSLIGSERRALPASQNSSLLWEGEQVWTKEALEAFKACFTDNLDESSDSFEEKFQRQLAGQDAVVVKLAAELVLVYFLFPSSVTAKRKRDLVQEVASWKQIEVPQAGLEAMQAFGEGIGGPGLAYNTRRPFEIGFLAESARRLVSMLFEERRTVLTDHGKLRALFEEVEGDATRQSRAILSFIFFFQAVTSESRAAATST